MHFIRVYNEKVTFEGFNFSGKFATICFWHGAMTIRDGRANTLMLHYTFELNENNECMDTMLIKILQAKGLGSEPTYFVQADRFYVQWKLISNDM